VVATRLAGGGDVAEAERQLLRLAELGAVDLVDSPLSKPHPTRSQEQGIMR